MKVVEGAGDLCRIEPGVFLGEPAMSLHVEHEVTSVHTLYHKEQSGDVREGGRGEREERVGWRQIGSVLQLYIV